MHVDRVMRERLMNVAEKALHSYRGLSPLDTIELILNEDAFNDLWICGTYKQVFIFKIQLKQLVHEFPKKKAFDFQKKNSFPI